MASGKKASPEETIMTVESACLASRGSNAVQIWELGVYCGGEGFDAGRIGEIDHGGFHARMDDGGGI